MEVRRTMKSMSVMEMDNRKKLEFMVPMDIPGRYQLMTKLKDLIIHIDSVVVKPVYNIPQSIEKSVGFFSTDGFWVGNFIAYGYNLRGEKTLLWDDFGIDIERKQNCVLTKFIKEKLSCDKDIVIVTAKETDSRFSLEFYRYLPYDK